MKSLLMTAVCLFSVYASAAQLDLKSGDNVVISANVDTRVTCNGSGRADMGSCDVSEKPRAVCLEKGFYPTACAELADGCNAQQATCISKGYYPVNCKDL